MEVKKKEPGPGVEAGVFGRGDALIFSSNGSKLNSSICYAVRNLFAFTETSTLMFIKCIN